MSTDEPTADDAPPRPPGTVGPYRVIGQLGAGGMAEVLLALKFDARTEFKRLVVVKRILTTHHDDPTFVQMFLDEARLAARLNHANVVQTYEVGQDGASPYLAMEFLEGQALNYVQRRARALGRKIPVPVALKVLCDALAGLHYAHELANFDGSPLGVIHRDVTPSNVFVTHDGLTKLVDFGIAKSATQREKTRAGTLKGKFPYMAPEQLRDEPISRQVDVWAMGVVVWEVLADARLFRGKSDLETVRAVMERPVPRLAAQRADVPAALDDVIAAALARDPAKRLASAEELRARLEDVALAHQLPLRQRDVAALMGDMFADAIARNRDAVAAFLQRTEAELAAESKLLRFRASTGELSVTTASASEPGPDMSSSMPTVTLNEPPPRALADAATAVDPRGVAAIAATVVTSKATAAAAVAAADAADDDDDAPRPAWQWALFGLGLAAVAAGGWYVFAH